MSADRDLLRAFPGSRFEDAPRADRLRWALGFTRALWGDHCGFACVGHGEPYLEAGMYRHHGFTQSFFEWPAASVELAEQMMTLASHGRDVYVTPMLRAEKGRKKGSGAGAQWAWVDLDGPMTDDRLRVLRQLGDAVRVVSSGTGHHVYFRLDEWTPIGDVENTNRSLAAMLDGDSKWDDTSFLRPPGTYNRKPLLRGEGPPALVQVIEIGGAS